LVAPAWLGILHPNRFTPDFVPDDGTAEPESAKDIETLHSAAPMIGMPMDIGGFLWLIIDVAFVAALAAVIIYGLREWRRRRNRVTEEVEKKSVDRVYRD
jgi:hypothetical protein